MENSRHTPNTQAEGSRQNETKLPARLCSQNCRKDGPQPSKMTDIPPHTNIFGFTDGRSAANSIASQLAALNDRPAKVIFLDLERVLEFASPTVIADVLATREVSG